MAAPDLPTLLTGLAADLATAGIGTWTPDGPLTTDPALPAVVVAPRLPAAPHRVLCLTSAGGSADQDGAPTVEVLARVRGDSPDSSWALTVAGQVYERWLHRRVPALAVDWMTPTTVPTDLGVDAQERAVVSLRTQITVIVPSLRALS